MHFFIPLQIQVVVVNVFMLKTLVERDEGVEIILLLRKGVKKSSVICKASRFLDEADLSKIEPRLRVRNLLTVPLLEGRLYPRFTLLGQSLGSMVTAFECCLFSNFPVFFDTMGASFTLPVVKSFSFLFLPFTGGITRCISYVHYPTISTDMLNVVKNKESTYNNDVNLASSGLKTQIKLIYYRFFARLYRCTGYFSDLTFTNSTWTKNHIDRLWKIDSVLLYPPCGSRVNFSTAYNSTSKRDSHKIISLGQFRPEKDHKKQLAIMKALIQRLDESGVEQKPTLYMIGGARGLDDLERIEELKSMCVSFGIQNNVVFEVNVTYSDLLKHFQTAFCGMHTMWNEHFGIAPVEMMANGVILVGHNSGGPKFDIIRQGVTGFLASSVEEYTNCLYILLTSSNREAITKLRLAASNSAIRFTDEVFSQHFAAAL
eukprot:maker-scaffold_7-snap-gene-12.39-mRNA-1 protein AED:0.15 eAED:0.18 QI:0/0/0/1/0.5/0.33/3/0/429